MIRHHRPGQPIAPSDVTIVGAGPVGLALALTVAQLGLSVLVLEAGDAVDAEHPAGANDIANPTRHAPLAVAMGHGLGGTSRWWGGRCVAFDDADFAGSRWPIDLSELGSRNDEAADFLGIGTPRFRLPDSALPTDDDLVCSTLERWTPAIDMAKRHQARLAAETQMTVLMNAPVARFDVTDGRTTAVILATGERVPVERLVIAAGGLGGMRLLLAAQARTPALFGGTDGPLGRYYMGHISGRIAQIVLRDDRAVDALDYFRDGPAWVRRRLTLSAAAQARDGLMNAAFWLDNPRFHEHAHGNGALSAVWLALAVPSLGRKLVAEGVRRAHVGPSPRPLTPHLANLLRAPWQTANTLARIAIGRVGPRPRRPGFLLRGSTRRYPLHYHAEHLGRPDSRVTLAGLRGGCDLPALHVDLRYGAEDVDSVIRSHVELDRQLRRTGLGRLEWMAEPDRLPDLVLDQATDGFHQIGIMRMGTDPQKSVVDRQLKAHRLDNLWVASTGVFPTSGQANPTFPAVAVAVRLAHTLAATMAGA